MERTKNYRGGVCETRQKDLKVVYREEISMQGWFFIAMAKEKRKISKSIRTHIRRQKARIRSTVAGVEEQKKQIEELYHINRPKGE